MKKSIKKIVSSFAAMAIIAGSAAGIAPAISGGSITANALDKTVAPSVNSTTTVQQQSYYETDDLPEVEFSIKQLPCSTAAKQRARAQLNASSVFNTYGLTQLLCQQQAELRISTAQRWYKHSGTTKTFVETGTLGDISNFKFFDGKNNSFITGVDLYLMEPARFVYLGADVEDGKSINAVAAYKYNTAVKVNIVRANPAPWSEYWAKYYIRNEDSLYKNR